jgi:hypothetical protein
MLSNGIFGDRTGKLLTVLLWVYLLIYGYLQWIRNRKKE